MKYDKYLEPDEGDCHFYLAPTKKPSCYALRAMNAPSKLTFKHTYLPAVGGDHFLLTATHAEESAVL
jgi:hypothetical protein